MSRALTPLATIVKTVTALVAKGDHAADKAEQFYKAAGLYLKEAKAHKPSGVTWPDFVGKHFPFGHRRAYELIRIADGHTTVEKVRTDKAKSVRKSRALRSARFPRGDRLLRSDRNEKPAASTSVSDGTSALRQFTASVLELVLLTATAKPARFAGTMAKGDDLKTLGMFLMAVADLTNDAQNVVSLEQRKIRSM